MHIIKLDIGDCNTVQSFHVNQGEQNMALHTGDENKAPKSAAAKPQPQAAQQQQSAQPSYGVGNFRSLLGRGTDAAGAGKFAETFQQILTEARMTDFRVTVMENEKYGILLSSVLISKTEPAVGGGRVTTVCVLAVAASAGRLPKRQIQIGGGQTIEIETVAGDCKDADMWERVKQCINTSVEPGTLIQSAGLAVLPEKVLQPTDVARCKMVLGAALEAVYRKMEEVQGRSVPFSVTMIPQSDRMQARVDPQPGKVENEVALPIRSDLAVQLTGYDTSNTANSLFATKETHYTTVDGYVDAMYVAPPLPMPGMAPSTKHYLANYHITKITSDLGAMTMEILLLGLHTAMILNKNKTWAMAFRQKVARENPLRDVGAIGWEVPQFTGDITKPGQLPVANAAFTPEALDQLITDAFHDNMQITIDLEEAALESFLTDIILRASRGDATAIRAVIVAADNLTAGKFSECYRPRPGFEQPFFSTDDRLFKGYYEAQGERHSLDDVDYLAMLNIHGPKGRLEVAQAWDLTHQPQGGSLEVRLDKRTRLTRDVLEDQMVITSYARPVVAGADFLHALAQAIAMCGINIQPSNILLQSGGVQRRTYEQATVNALDASRMAGAFQFGGTGTQQSPLSNFNGGWGM